MSEKQDPQRGAAEDAGDAPLTDTERAAAQRPPGGPREEPADRREAEQAHGGSMAPGLVDATGNEVAEPPPAAPER